MAIRSLSASTNSLRKGLEGRLGVFPADTSIGDTDTILETGFALRGNLLTSYKCISVCLFFDHTQPGLWFLLTLVDVALNHDTHDRILARSNLLSKDTSHLGLVLVVLLRVSMAAVNHKTSGKTLGSQLSLGLLDALGVIVGALLASTENDEAVRVAHGANNGSNTWLGDREEVVRVLDRANGIHSNIQSAVGTVLEANREGQTRSQFTVNLRLSGARTYGTNRKTVGQELWRDGVQHLTSNGHALAGQINKKLARGAEALVDLEAVVKVRVVDQTLPSNSGPRFLEIGAHDNQQLILVFLFQFQKLIAVLQRHGGVVDRAWSDDNEQPLLVGVCSLNDCNGLFTTLEDRLLRLLRQSNLMLQQVGRGQGVVSANYQRAIW